MWNRTFSEKTEKNVGATDYEMASQQFESKTVNLALCVLVQARKNPQRLLDPGASLLERFRC